MKGALALALLCGLSGPAAAQMPATALAPAPAVATPEPARLAAARALIEGMMPADRRDSMMRDMIGPMMVNLRQGMEASPQFAAMLAEKPEARAKLIAFIDRQMASSIRMATAAMPALLDAMAIAYARQFSVAQLREAASFYATPTGRAFVDAMPKVMADPAVQAAQRGMMTDAMARVQTETAQLARELAELEAKPSGRPN